MFEAKGFWALNNGQMSIFLYLICVTGRSRIGVGCTGGGAPRNSGCFMGIINNGQKHIFILYLCHWQVTNWCGVQGAEPPETQGFYTLNYRQTSIFLYFICVTGRSQIGVGCRAGAPRNSGVLYIKLSSDVHILYFICDTGKSRIGLGSRGRSTRKHRAFGQ